MTLSFSSIRSYSGISVKAMQPQSVLDFWFHADMKPYWFARSDQVDEQISTKFKETWKSASQAELWAWRDSAEGCLAEIIVLDQFSRNLFRNSRLAFAQDPLALGLAQQAIRHGLDKALTPEQRLFLYLPFMHSESVLIHECALKLFGDLGNPQSLDFEKKHKIIIDKFGRYPHRNSVLGRTSSPEETEFLSQPGSGF